MADATEASGSAAYEWVDEARAICDETGADEPVLEAIADAYFSAWQACGNRHINQWPLALLTLAAIRRAGYDVVRRDA